MGWPWSTGQQFDASWDRGDTFKFELGKGQVIAGWDQGVAGMKVGGRRRITIPPAWPTASAAPAASSGRTRRWCSSSTCSASAELPGSARRRVDVVNPVNGLGIGLDVGQVKVSTTGSWPLRTSTQESGSSGLALISWWGA